MTDKRVVKIEFPEVIAEKWLPESCDSWDCQYVFHWKWENGFPSYCEVISDYDGILWHEGLGCDVNNEKDLFSPKIFKMMDWLDELDYMYY